MTQEPVSDTPAPPTLLNTFCWHNFLLYGIYAVLKFSSSEDLQQWKTQKLNTQLDYMQETRIVMLCTQNNRVKL